MSRADLLELRRARYGEESRGLLHDLVNEAALIGEVPSIVLSYYAANWAVTDWYINGTTGNDSNDGSEAHPLATAEELSARLAVAIPISHPVTVHIAQGSYGTLAVRVIQSALACPFDVVGQVVYTDIGTVTSYTDRVAATNTEPLLAAAGVVDWTAHVGKRVDVLSGTQAGAIAWVGKVNPQSLGVSVARVTRFGGVTSSSTGNSAAVVPSTGASLSLATLPSIAVVRIESQALHPTSGNVLATRGIRLKNLAIGDATLLGNAQPGIDGCSLQTLTGTFGTTSGTAAQTAHGVTVQRSAVIPRTTDTTSVFEWLAFNLCLFLSTNRTVQLTDCNALYSLFQGSCVYPVRSYLIDNGIFDSPAGFPGVYAQPTPAFGCIISTLWGQGNATAGVQLPAGASIASSGSQIVGATGAISVSGSVIPWTALPWVDGERIGEATLVGGTVDVTVPYVLATQKITACAKTFGGTPGFLSAVYVNATTIRITSSSATDTSVVTWHILPVGDNAVIRS